jgi:hypothetical protein
VSEHSRSFHLHVHQRTSRPGVLRWSVVRSLWRPMTQSRVATFASGELEVTVGEASPQWTGLVALELALAAYRAQLEAEHPEDHV